MAAAAASSSSAGHDAGGAMATTLHRPKEHELVPRYLRPKIAGEPLPPFAAFIHDTDVCSAPPAELTAAHAPAPASPGGKAYWYFFSPMHCHGHDRIGPRYLRAAYRVGKSGLWIPGRMFKVKAEGSGGGGAVGCMRWFEYADRAAPGPRVKEWRMVEYMVPQEEEAADGEQQLALCVVWRRRGGRAADVAAAMHGGRVSSV